MMKLTIEIPKEFENHYKYDKFEDSLSRLSYDMSNLLKDDKYSTCISWKFDLEVLNMLITALTRED